MKFVFPPFPTTIIHPPFEQDILLPYADALCVEGPFGGLYSQETGGGHYRIGFQSMICLEPVSLTFLQHKPAVMLVYVFQGDITIGNEHGRKQRLVPYSYYSAYAPAGHYTLELGKGVHSLLQIDIPDFLMQQLAISYLELFTPCEHFNRQSRVEFLCWLSGISNTVSETIIRLLYCKLEETERILYQTARIMDLLVLMTEDIAARYKDFPAKMRFTGEDIGAVKAALDLQSSHDGTPLTLRELARKVHMHPKKLNAGFRLLKGKTSRALGNETMITKAKMLLKETQLSIVEIAYEMGYCNSSAFIRAFKRGTGISPAAYRK